MSSFKILVVFSFCSPAKLCPDSRRWMRPVLNVRIIFLHSESWPLFSPRPKLKYATYKHSWTRLDLVPSNISFRSHPVLLGCIMLSVVPGTQRNLTTLLMVEVGMEAVEGRTINSKKRKKKALYWLFSSYKQSNLCQHLWQEASQTLFKAIPNKWSSFGDTVKKL